MKVIVWFLEAPYDSWKQQTFQNVLKTYQDGDDFYGIELDDGSVVSIPIENIFTIREYESESLEYGD